MESLPRERSRRRELAGERLLLLAHLELGALGGLAQRERVLGRGRAARDERVDVERREPRTEPLAERRERRGARLQLDVTRTAARSSRLSVLTSA